MWQDSESGVIYFDILPVSKQTPGLPQTPPGSGIDPPPGLPQTPKNTEVKKTKKEDLRGLSEIELTSLLREYDRGYFNATGKLAKYGKEGEAHFAEFAARHNIPSAELRDYLKQWATKWRLPNGESQFWPISIMDFNAKLLARLDKDRMIANDIDAEVKTEAKALMSL